MLSALISLDALQRVQSTVTTLALNVIVLCIALRLACPALTRMSKKVRVVFCAFAIAAAVSAQKANTNAPPDDVSGPVPELSGDPEPGSEGDDSGDDLPDDVQGPLFALAPLHLAGDTENRPGAIVLPIPFADGGVI